MDLGATGSGSESLFGHLGLQRELFRLTRGSRLLLGRLAGRALGSFDWLEQMGLQFIGSDDPKLTTHSHHRLAAFLHCALWHSGCGQYFFDFSRRLLCRGGQHNARRERCGPQFGQSRTDDGQHSGSIVVACGLAVCHARHFYRTQSGFGYFLDSGDCL